MHRLTGEEDEEQQRVEGPSDISAAAAAADWWQGQYLALFTVLYGLSFSMPFWTDVPLPPDPSGQSQSQHGTADDRPGSDGNRSVHSQPSSHVWGYSWEYAGLAVRCVVLLLLLCGCALCLRRLCCSGRGHHHHHPPTSISSPSPSPPLPTLCGIVAGVMGVYAELVLGLCACLLAPNQALTESQVFCSVTSIFCLCVGLVLYRARRSRNLQHRPASNRGLLCRHPTHDVGHSGHVHVNDFHPDHSAFPDRRPGVATATVDETSPPRDLWEAGDHPRLDLHSEEEDEPDKRQLEALSSKLSGERWPAEDLPEDLKTLEDSPRDRYPPAREHFEDGPSEEFPTELGGVLPNGDDDGPAKEPPNDFRDQLPKRRYTRRSVNLTHNGDFDHQGQFIDDDLFYHSSDDDILERFLGPGTNSSMLEQQHQQQEQEQQEEQGCQFLPSGSSPDSRISGSSCSTACLVHTDRSLLLPFGDSEEFHSLSDDSFKNKTWP